MGNASFSDGTADNPKLINAGPVAAWLWFCGVLYCRRGLTDGFIPKAVVPALVVGLKGAYRHAQTLCDVGLWHAELGGYRVNDFLVYNPSKSAMDQYKEKDRLRKQAERGIRDERPNGVSGRNPNGQTSGQPYASADATHAGTKSESASESTKGLDSEVSEESARETSEPVSALAPVWRPPAATRAALTPSHAHCHPAARAACGRGSCVPPFIVREWRQACESAGLAEDIEIAKTVGNALASVPDGYVFAPTDPPKYWRSWWATTHGPAPMADTKPQSATAHTMAAARAVLGEL